MKGLFEFRFCLFLKLLFWAALSHAQATDLIISEYVEGSSSNKYIEIYNGTSSSINLSDYQLRLYANGSSSVTTSNTLSGSLGANTTIVYRNSSATIYTGTTTVLSSVNFNGDDAMALFKISTSSFVDIVGNIGCDPGSAWTSGSFTTVDKTIVRNSSVCVGITTDDGTSCPFGTLATEWTQSNQDVVSNLGSHSMSCVSCVPETAPSTAASSAVTSPGCVSASLSWTNGDGGQRLVVLSTSPISSDPVNTNEYTASTDFGSGETIGSGQHTISNGTSSSVNIYGLTANTTYYFEVFEFNVTTLNCTESYLTTSSLSGSFTTASSCSGPQIRSILVDACSSNEGVDELIVIKNGSDILVVDDLEVEFPNDGIFCNSGCGTKTLVDNASYISSLNSTAGCTLFVYSNVIPAGATIIVFTGATPTYSFDFGDECGSGPIYAIFCNNTSTTGRFANSGAGTRTTAIDDGTYTESVTYTPADVSGGNGTYADFTDAGSVTYRNELDCATPLGASIAFFSGQISGDCISLSWVTLSETGNDYFVVEKLVDGLFVEVARVASPYGTSDQLIEYDARDCDVEKMNYYRLRQVDYNGVASVLSEVISVNANLEVDNGVLLVPNPASAFTCVVAKDDIRSVTVLTPDLRTVYHEQPVEKVNQVCLLTDYLPAGVYIVQVETGLQTLVRQLVIE